MNQSTADLTRERSLVERARSGDEEAFAALVTENSARVYGALRRFGLDQQESEKVAQEVFLRAWRALPRRRGPSSQRGPRP
jgi:RNA polymerase sigma-70 factor (ECF subfamily)